MYLQARKSIRTILALARANVTPPTIASLTPVHAPFSHVNCW